MTWKHFAQAGAVMAILAAPAMAQTLQTSPQTSRTSIPPSSKPLPGSGKATPPTSYRSSTSAININTATAAELDTLPGIGKARAAKIIKDRPYKSVDELESRHVIPQNVYNRIKSQVTTHPA